MTTEQPEVKQPSKARPAVMTMLTMVVAIGALLLALKLNQDQKSQAKQLDKAVNMLIKQQSTADARFQAHQTVSLRHERLAKEDRIQLMNQIKSTYDQCQNVSDDWRLYKARHLLELAQINASFSQDSEQTEALLRSADAVLAPIHNPDLVPVRQKLAEDIKAQHKAATLDTTGAFIKLQSAIDETWSLPIIPLPEPKPEPEPTTNAPQTLKAHVLKSLNHLVTIKHHDEPLKPTPTLAYEAMLRQAVRLNLEEAKWALLQKNEAIYQAALTNAIHYLEQTFAANAASTKQVLTMLNEMKDIKLIDAAIMPTDALKSLNQVIQRSNHHDGENA